MEIKNKAKENKISTSKKISTKNIFKNKKILRKTKIIYSTLFFEKQKTLVIGDLHIGQEEGFNKEGILIPRTNFSRLIENLKKVFEKTGKVKKVILLGDIKHEFGSANNQEWDEIIKLFEFFEKNSEKLIILRGNHDNYLKPIADWKGISLSESYSFENIFFIHGDKVIDSDKKILIMGHEHPAIVLSDEHKSEKYKCFIKIKSNKKEIIVLPSMNALSIGTDITKEKLLSPYLQNINEFECWVIEENNQFYFGKIKKE
jgi:uncharacterized protein